MILTWVGVIFFGLLGAAGVITSIAMCDTKGGKIAGVAFSVFLASIICFGLIWHLYCTESGLRAQKSFDSAVHGGLYRIVRVYDMEGDQIAEYKGKFDLEESQTDGVTKIKFDLDGKRHIIYSSTGTVIIDEIPDENKE